MRNSNSYAFKGIISFILFSILFILVNIGNVVTRNDGLPGIPFDSAFSIISFFGLVLVPLIYFILAFADLKNSSN